MGKKVLAKVLKLFMNQKLVYYTFTEYINGNKKRIKKVIDIIEKTEKKFNSILDVS